MTIYSWFIPLFITANQAADTSTHSAPRAITPKGQSYLRTSDPTNSMSGQHLTIFPTQKGTCTYSTHTSDCLEVLLQRAKKLESSEIFIHQSVFLKGICTTIPDNTIGLVWHCLPHQIASELSKLTVKADEFKKLQNLGQINSSSMTIVIITALSPEDNTELFNRFKDELRQSQLTNKNFILANIPQASISAPRSVQLPRRKPVEKSPERGTKSADTSPRSITPDGAVFAMDFDE
jgi:hypothetical protein